MFMSKYHHWPSNLPTSLRNTIDTNAPTYVTNDLDENTVNWYNSHNNTTYRNSLFFKGPLIFSDPLLSELANLRSSIDNLKSKTRKMFLDFEHSGDPEEWAESKFFIHTVQGIRQSERIKTSVQLQ